MLRRNGPPEPERACAKEHWAFALGTPRRAATQHPAEPGAVLHPSQTGQVETRQLSLALKRSAPHLANLKIQVCESASALEVSPGTCSSKTPSTKSGFKSDGNMKPAREELNHVKRPKGSTKILPVRREAKEKTAKGVRKCVAKLL